jgi:fatty acid desaturase
MRRGPLLTWFVAGGTYGGWAMLTLSYSALPLWIVVPLAAWLLAWHGSLQHEIIHGHLTSSRRVNAILAWPPLGLWLPFPLYEESHLAHHGCRRLTDPGCDPESYYVAPERWARMGFTRRAMHWALSTLAGRLLLGPWVMVSRLLAAELLRILHGDRSKVSTWAFHLAGCALLLGWTCGVCGIAPWMYVLAFVYPGLALTLLRSFAEHRPEDDQNKACAIVEAGPLLSLLFLNNNYHALHHRRPDLPWYELSIRYGHARDATLESNGRFLFKGYTEIVRRYALRPKDSPVARLQEGGRA